MTAIGVSTYHLILLYAKLSSESLLQASRVKSSKRSELVGLQTRVNKSGKSGNVSGIEDYYHMLYVRAVLLDIVAKLSSNLAVAYEQILAGHTVFTRSTTRRDDVLSTRESNLRVNRIREICTRECAMAHFFIYTVYARLEDVIQADVRSKTEHECRLNHVAADHTTGTNDNEFFVSQKFHNNTI